MPDVTCDLCDQPTAVLMLIFGKQGGLWVTSCDAHIEDLYELDESPLQDDEPDFDLFFEQEEL